MFVHRYCLLPFEHAAPNVVALGNFDGLHQGHASVLQEAVLQATALKATPSALTFAPNPSEFFFPATRPHNMMSLREKLCGMRALGIAQVFVARFNADFAALTAQEFAANLLVENLRAVHVVTGERFVFGHRRGGNTALLGEWLAEKCIGYSEVASVKDALGITSSTRIREALAHGEVAQAEALLGRAVSISGRVMHGQKRGRTLGFPTLNLSLERRFRPKFGVYQVSIYVEGLPVPHAGIANIGVKPSFGKNVPVLEAHSFSELPQLYGQRVRIELQRFIRPEMKFENAESLVSQIKQDILQISSSSR